MLACRESDVVEIEAQILPNLTPWSVVEIFIVTNKNLSHAHRILLLTEQTNPKCRCPLYQETHESAQ